MNDIKTKCLQTTQNIANKILLLRRVNNLTQEEFAERVGLDRRTIARAEDGKHRPSAETLEMLSYTFSVPISYFYDNSIYKSDINKKALIYKINTKLNILSKANLNKVNNFIDIILN